MLLALIFLSGIVRYLTFFLKTLLLESRDCVRISDLFTGHAVLSIKEKVSLFSILAIEESFKTHLRPLKAENLKGKYKKFTRLPFFFNLVRFKSTSFPGGSSLGGVGTSRLATVAVK